MSDVLNCKICGKENIDDIINHVLIKHGITYQKYCEQYYKIPANYEYILTPQLVEQIMQYYINRTDESQSIKDYYTNIALQNQYLFNKLVNIFYEYTLAIYKYLDISINLDNFEKYDLIQLEANKNYVPPEVSQQQYTEKRRKQYDNNLRSVECKICGSQCNEKNILQHVSVAHKMSKEDYLTTYYDIPKDMNFKKLRFVDVLNMYEELAKSKFDNFRDCYQALYDEVCMYDELSEKLGYKVNAICEGLHLDIKQKWTEEHKAALSKSKIGKKWTPLQRQRILEGKGIIDKNGNNINDNNNTKKA